MTAISVLRPPGPGGEAVCVHWQMTPSKSALDRLPKQLATYWEAGREPHEAALREALVIPAGTVSLAVSLDRWKARTETPTALSSTPLYTALSWPCPSMPVMLPLQRMSNSGTVTLIGATGSDENVFVLYNILPPSGDPEGMWSVILKAKSDSWEPYYRKQAWLTAFTIDRAGQLLAVSMDGKAYLDLPKRGRSLDTKCDDGLIALWMSPEGTLFAVGNNGERIQIVGKKSRDLTRDSKRRCLYAVHGLSNSLVYAGGDEGVIWRWDGNQWNEVEGPGKATINAVRCVSATEIYAACANGNVHCFNGKTWTTLRFKSPRKAREVFSLAHYRESIYVAAGDQGVWRFDPEAGFVQQKDWVLHELTVVGGKLMAVGGNLIASFDGEIWEGWDIED